MIFKSEWTKLKYTLNLVRCFLLHSPNFQYFFYGFKVNCQIHNWYIQKYLKGMFHEGMLLIWKEYFTRAILSFSSPRCAIIARLNVIYTKFRRAMIAQLNKIWRVRACAGVCACNRTPLTARPDNLQHYNLPIRKREQSYQHWIKRGPKTEPWDSPNSISVLWLDFLLILILWVWFDK